MSLNVGERTAMPNEMPGEKSVIVICGEKFLF
jgi:hypothetical protein